MKKVLSLVIALMMVFSCASALAELTFTTGSTAGTYYAFGGVLAQYISDHSDVKITAVAGEGSAANIDMLDMHYAQLGFVQSDVAYYAANGIRFEQYEGAPITSFTALAALYNETVQLVTCNPDIKSMDDNFSGHFTCGIYGILGPNGAGKSTLLNMMAQLISPTSGKILFDDRDISLLGSEYRKQIGYLPQNDPAAPLRAPSGIYA